MNLGDCLSLINGSNIYKIIQKDGDNFIQLECIFFVNSENLGDNIISKYSGIKLWICSYHWHQFRTVSLIQ